MPIDLSILKSKPVLVAVDVGSLQGSHSLDPDLRSRTRGADIRNDINLIHDLKLPARIKNDFTPHHKLTARVASIGNDRIPVFEHLYSSYGQGQTKDALWDFLEEEDNHLVPGNGEYDYLEDYGPGEDDMYWYSKENEYEGSDNKISWPQWMFRERKNDKPKDGWQLGRRMKAPGEHRNRNQDRGIGDGHRLLSVPSFSGLRNLKPPVKRSEDSSVLQDDTSKWSWSRSGKKNIFFTAGWGPGGMPSQNPRKLSDAQQSSTEEKEEKSPKQPPWRRPGPMWGVPHLFGPYW